MKPDQRHNPKYWVANDMRSDDVLLETASKSLGDTTNKAMALLGDEFSESYIGMILIELKWRTP